MCTDLQTYFLLQNHILALTTVKSPLTSQSFKLKTKIMDLRNTFKESYESLLYLKAPDLNKDWKSKCASSSV